MIHRLFRPLLHRINLRRHQQRQHHTMDPYSFPRIDRCQSQMVSLDDCSQPQPQPPFPQQAQYNEQQKGSVRHSSSDWSSFLCRSKWRKQDPLFEWRRQLAERRTKENRTNPNKRTVCPSRAHGHTHTEDTSGRVVGIKKPSILALSVLSPVWFNLSVPLSLEFDFGLFQQLFCILVGLVGVHSLHPCRHGLDFLPSRSLFCIIAFSFLEIFHLLL